MCSETHDNYFINIGNNSAKISQISLDEWNFNYFIYKQVPEQFMESHSFFSLKTIFT